MDLAPSRVSISIFPSDFSDPIDPDEFEAPRDAPPSSIPQMGDLYLLFDEAVKKLEGLVGFNLKPDQQRALKELYMSSDLCLVAATGFGKTIVFTGYHTLLKPDAGAITIIISPLKAIENGQAADLRKLGSNYRLFVVVGETNTSENRHDIALGKYTHIWISAEAILGDLVEKKGQSQEHKPNKRRKVTRWPGCEYEDRGTFTSVIQYTPFCQRLCLVAIDEMHLCA
jgi:superfamily II DNA helicase RecQ